MRNAAVGVQRVIARLRPDMGSRSAAATNVQRQTPSIVRGLRAESPGRPRLAGERLVSITAVGLVAIALIVSNLGNDVAAGPTGGTDGAGTEPRIALGGAVAGLEGAPYGGTADGAGTGDDLGHPGLSATSSTLAPDDRVRVDGPFGSDGTLLKPVSVDTSVADGKDLMRTYRVRTGDTLTGIANRFDVSMMTVWWANKLKSKSDLHIGQVLTIPPVSGVVVTVAATDTLEALATKYEVEAADIVAINELDDPVLVVGQTLTIPGARSSAIATPKPKPTAAATPKPRASRAGTSRPPATYSGGRFAWPVAGGYISQYFHYGHYGIDIAADRGTPVKAAGGGTVIFAGWKSNGGGYQVWIAHGSGLYTTYNHMSSVSVGRGQGVSRGQQVGRVGATGMATGPHLHFEVWRGAIWSGGTRVNPLSYL
ncbi:MAG TPA: M23 family metallopeptidase [Patescibacteria group bacterium]|nr:M23 family metallopeptidase [Patescibacteria group bacterium]